VKTARRQIGFVSTRLAGTDGVSLEAAKWASILAELGYECSCFAGESDWPPERSYVVPEAHFGHPDVLALNADVFDNPTRSSPTSGKIQALRYRLKERLYDFVHKFGIGLLIVENALSLPVNIPLGLALTELVAETGIPTVAHHHDFSWERPRFAVNAAADYLRAAFPPVLPAIHHVVINSFAGCQLALRTGASSKLIPNVMDFETPPPQPDDYARGFRAALGIAPGDWLLLQPTRIVPRKRIEHAIELARRLGPDSVLVISHSGGDEGSSYEAYLRDYAALLGVRVIFAAERIAHHRGPATDGRPVFALADAYQQADLVTYPSTVEGFGNAFLETIYYRRPIVMSNYEIFQTDILPKGFQVIGFDSFVTEETVRQARSVLEDPERAREMTEHNYVLGRRYYSYHNLRKHLVSLMSECVGT
jgi:glycosyltransferase involved in cell wall biosynthesis